MSGTILGTLILFIPYNNIVLGIIIYLFSDKETTKIYEARPLFSASLAGHPGACSPLLSGPQSTALEVEALAGTVDLV